MTPEEMQARIDALEMAVGMPRANAPRLSSTEWEALKPWPEVVSGDYNLFDWLRLNTTIVADQRKLIDAQAKQITALSAEIEALRQEVATHEERLDWQGQQIQKSTGGTPSAQSPAYQRIGNRALPADVPIVSGGESYYPLQLSSGPGQDPTIWMYADAGDPDYGRRVGSMGMSGDGGIRLIMNAYGLPAGAPETPFRRRDLPGAIFGLDSEGIVNYKAWPPLNFGDDPYAGGQSLCIAALGCWGIQGTSERRSTRAVMVFTPQAGRWLEVLTVPSGGGAPVRIWRALSDGPDRFQAFVDGRLQTLKARDDGTLCVDGT